MEFKGTISNVRYKVITNSVEFYIGKKLLYADFFLPVHDGDEFFGVIELKNKKYRVAKPPMILIGKSNDLAITIIKQSLNITHEAANVIFSVLQMIEPEDTFDAITNLVQKYHTTRIVPDKYPNLDIKLLQGWYKHVNLRQLYLLGITDTEIENYNKDALEMYENCIENPYTVYTIPLTKADDIITRLGKQPSAIDAECGKILRTIYEYASQRGWSCVPLHTINQTFPNYQKYLEILKEDYGVLVDYKSMYLKHIYDIENYVGEYVKNKLEEDGVIGASDPLDCYYPDKHSNCFIRYSAQFSDTTSADQKIAIQAALDHNFVLISGMAGSGKTKTIGEIVNNLKIRKLNYCVTGFTGKSVERLREVINEKLSTMHRMIYTSIKHTKFNVVIIDEISMVTTELFYQFIMTFDVEQFVFVGDVNQLPPISWGSFLLELLKTKRVPTYYLTHNHRVKGIEEDGILLNSYRILSGCELVEADNFKIMIGGISKVVDVIKTCYNNAVLSSELTVISPYKKFLPEINRKFQFIYNSLSKAVVDEHGNMWKVTDKVILTKNLATKNIFNGQHGVITKVANTHITVDFGTALYDFSLRSKFRVKNDNSNELTVDKLKLAYCLTAHKAQGSENDYIIIYIDSVNDSGFLNMNLLYTCCTRAKKFVWFITPNIDLINSAVQRKLAYRAENLSQRILKS